MRSLDPSCIVAIPIVNAQSQRDARATRRRWAGEQDGANRESRWTRSRRRPASRRRPCPVSSTASAGELTTRRRSSGRIERPRLRAQQLRTDARHAAQRFDRRADPGATSRVFRRSVLRPGPPRREPPPSMPSPEAGPVPASNRRRGEGLQGYLGAGHVDGVIMYSLHGDDPLPDSSGGAASRSSSAAGRRPAPGHAYVDLRTGAGTPRPATLSRSAKGSSREPVGGRPPTTTGTPRRLSWSGSGSSPWREYMITPSTWPAPR